jgi:hypothetical protein
MTKNGKKTAKIKNCNYFKHMEFIDRFIFFWVIFALNDLATDSQSGSRYGSRDPIDSGST